MRLSFSSLVLIWILFSCQQQDPRLDKSGFSQINKEIANILYEIRYAGSDNFVGAIVDGYQGQSAYLTKPALGALKDVQKELNEKGFGLKVFDAYRPQKAVDHFVRWGQAITDTLTKARFYPKINKAQVFELGYVAEKSGHSRGSTVDLTIINLATLEELDMGSAWDYFGEISHHDSPLVDSVQNANRNLLRSIMVKYGFKPYANEWWHYTLENEPYPETYFNFDNAL